jgi:hypothetical protein
MNISFIKEKDKQKYFLLIFIFCLVIIALVIFGNFLKQKKLSQPVEIYSFEFKKKNIKIDWDFLESPALKELSSFVDIRPFSGSMGRENPYNHY